jgi:hypothetical protein
MVLIKPSISDENLIELETKFVMTRKFGLHRNLIKVFFTLNMNSNIFIIDKMLQRIDCFSIVSLYYKRNIYLCFPVSNFSKSRILLN